MAPLISIIIPTYNPGKQLTSALYSIYNQSFTDYEILVIDGNSTDGTVATLKEMGQLISWISESDKGIYDAMNKGINRAKGQWLYFLGADDILMPNALQEISKSLTSENQLVFGDVLFDNGYQMRSFLGSRTWFQNTVHHQSAFYNSSLFNNFRYDPTFKILADYELNLRVFAMKTPYYYSGTLIAQCSTGGASADLDLAFFETNSVRQRYISSIWLQKTLSFLLYIYTLQKQLRFRLYGHRV
jgi:putative colanic acid biosynthesis glycosyltransferase